jgi:hypothetical protein
MLAVITTSGVFSFLFNSHQETVSHQAFNPPDPLSGGFLPEVII